MYRYLLRKYLFVVRFITFALGRKFLLSYFSGFILNFVLKIRKKNLSDFKLLRNSQDV